MEISLANKIQDLKDAIKNSERILEDDLQQIQHLQNTIILSQQKMVELDTLISDSIVQEEILKKKNAIIQTNIDHIQNHSIIRSNAIEQLKQSYQNSENINNTAKEKHQQLQNKVKELESHYLENQNHMNIIMSDFEKSTIEKQNLASQINQLKNYQNDYFELSNKYNLLEKQEEFLQEQLTMYNTIYEEQEKQIRLLSEENEKYSNSISKNKKESTYFQQNIKEIEDQLSLITNGKGFPQISEDYLFNLKAQISLTEDQISHLGEQQYAIEKSLTVQSKNYNMHESVNIEDFTKKAEKMQKELIDNKKTLYNLEKEREELIDESINKKFLTVDNQQKLFYLQGLQSQIKKMKSKDSFYQKEILELRSKSEKLENDLIFSENNLIEKKSEQDRLIKKMQIDKELKLQHEKQMEQIQSKFKAVKIKSNHEEIEKYHKENKDLMKRILKFEDLLGQKKMKKKKVAKKPIFVL